MDVLDPITPEIQCDRSHSVLVSTNHGPIQGFLHTTDTGIKANVFLGVPFAKPPVGELRFERPEPPLPWTEPLETKNMKKSCIPYKKEWIRGNPSEDCLYLNVMAPRNTNIKHPVLVYIPGGGFNFSDCIRAGFDKYVKNFVSRGVVVVTITYRVGIYGFFSTGDSVAEGNNGLWDQLAGVKWVNENIAKFGGDPDNVTLWGQSAGAASVDLLAISPFSRDYVHQTIQASGSAINEWVTGSCTVRCSKNVAIAMGCKSTDSNEIKTFLKNQSAEDILEVCSAKFTSENRANDGYLWFAPRIDSAFFGVKTIEQLISETAPKPTLFGLMINEGGTFLSFGLTPEKRKNYSKDDVIKNIQSKVPKSIVGAESDAIQKDLQEFYLKRDNSADADSEFYVEQNFHLISDLMFNAAVLHEIELKESRNWPVYFYIWNYINEKIEKIIGAKGAFHSYELWFVSDQKVLSFDEHGPIEYKIQEIYAEMLSNFVKTGNPSIATLEFPRFNKKDRQVFWVDPEPHIDVDGFAEVNEFYDKLEEKYEYSVRRGIKKSDF